MNQISKVSDVTYQDVAEYLRLDEVTQSDVGTLQTLIAVAKSYMCKYTGKAEQELDGSADFVIVLLVLCQDMWDTRALYVDSSNVNKVVESILGLHQVNLL